MISICGQYLIGNVQRINCRFLASVVPKCQVDDFSVKNEPIFSYLKGSKERKELEKALDKMSNTCQDVPIMIGDKEYRTKEVKHQVMPHDHKKSIAKYYWATKVSCARIPVETQCLSPMPCNSFVRASVK